MAARIGQDKELLIDDNVLDEICQTLSEYVYETGGIIGANKSGKIIAFQFDKTESLNPYEYHPNVDFLNEVINEKWSSKNVKFVGFVHSHLHNGCISKQDIEYAEQILKDNKSLESILLGVLNLSEVEKSIAWTEVF